MDNTPKTRILALAKDLGLSESYAALLHMVAAIDSGTYSLAPNSENEQQGRDGYRRGLLSALLCVAMHERQCAPRAAVLLVKSHLNMARTILQNPTPESSL